MPLLKLCYCSRNVLSDFWSSHLGVQFLLWQNIRKIMKVMNLFRKCRWHPHSPCDISYYRCLRGNWLISVTENGVKTKSSGTFIPLDSHARFNPWCRNWIVLLQKVPIKSWRVRPRNKALKQIEWMFPSQNELSLCVCIFICRKSD